MCKEIDSTTTVSSSFFSCIRRVIPKPSNRYNLSTIYNPTDIQWIPALGFEDHLNLGCRPMPGDFRFYMPPHVALPSCRHTMTPTPTPGLHGRLPGKGIIPKCHLAFQERSKPSPWLRTRPCLSSAYPTGHGSSTPSTKS